MGNSEVGHMNMGAGRIVYQELTRIDVAIRDGSFFRNEVIAKVMDDTKANGKDLHLMGLLSDGGVHSSIEHLFALVRMAKERGVERVWIHAFMDGRDTPPKSGKGFVERTLRELQAIGLGKIATISGRYYAMDRDKNWERTKLAYDAMVRAEGVEAGSGVEAMERSYENGVTDEFIVPVVLHPEGRIKDGDGVIFFNFRPDRARQITRAITDAEFNGFERGPAPLVRFVCMTQYDATLGLPLAYPPQKLVDNLASVLSEKRVRQLHTAETEKYAHVTFFFNCGREEPYDLENRILIPSPKVATYDLQPEMSAPEVAASAAAAIDAGHTDVLIMNFANADMVGHTGVMGATMQAIEAVDRAVGEVVAAILRAGGTALITADHGNAEQMVDYATGEPMTSHTTNPVPLIMAGQHLKLRESGILADVGPTILDLLNIPKPEAMTANTLIQR
jgi:2,3-bisphosphoglycerate-independent phosphoglycerate mutase